MKYISFHIENYKAIRCVDVAVSRNVIPLIGINESGKTTILHAILAFDKAKDHLMDGSHVDPKNKYMRMSKRNMCEISAYVSVSDYEEACEIVRESDINTGGPLYSWCEKTILALKPIKITRECSEDLTLLNSYALDEAPREDGEKKAYDKLKKAVITRLPNILYFDDFSDRVPSEVAFPSSYYKEGQSLKTRGSNREWQEIVIEIFNRSLDGDLSLIEFCEIDDEDERNNYLDDVAEVLNEEIISEWRNLKSAHAAFDESESDSLKLSISARKRDDDFVFSFKVEDTELEGHNRRFDITNRSKGFQWFFNFIVKLKFNPKYREHPNDAIYLLDEPGSYLHSSAQEELLAKLVEISKDNTILFCTHSQYLLDPETINLSDVRIVSKSDGAISITNYGDSGAEKNGGAYSALNDALHLKYGLPLTHLNYCLIVEGVTDWCLMKMFLNLGSIEIIPGAGCTQLKSLISIAAASSKAFLVLLDKDSEGDKAAEEYSGTFGDLFIYNSYQYQGIAQKKKFVLEDLLSQKDIELIKQKTGCSKIKKAIVKLYYSDASIVEEVKKQLSDEAKENFGKLEQVVYQHFAGSDSL